MSKILIVDDEKSIREALSDILLEEGYDVTVAQDGLKGLEKLKNEDIDLVLTDIKMPKMDGFDFFEKAKAQDITTPFIILSAHGSIDLAVDVTKKGAFDFMQKPLDLNRVLLSIRNALDNNQLKKEAVILRKKIKKKNVIIGESEVIVELNESIKKVATTHSRVLISGENGTGKELVAQQLHQLSERSSMPLIEVNCATYSF